MTIEKDTVVIEAYKIVIKDLKKRFGKRCNSYAIFCPTCTAYRILDDIIGLADTLKYDIQYKQKLLKKGTKLKPIKNNECKSKKTVYVCKTSNLC